MASLALLAAFLGALLLAATVAAAEVVPDTEAAALVADLLAKRPSEELAVDGRLKVSNSKVTLSRIHIKYTVRLHPDGWEGIYEAGNTNASATERLTVVHRNNSPNQYFYARASVPNPTPGEPTRLTGDQAAIPFANSDFWLSDLGLEFLHWPKQRLLKDKIQMRNHRLCHVLESTNPNPVDTNYAQVVSWIDREFGGVIHAIAYDTVGRTFKTFSLRSFAKGQVTGMQILNDKTDTKTYLELQPEAK